MVEYLLHLLIFICLYTLLAQSLNLSAGFAGLISLAHAGFYGIGAYTTAILSTKFHLPFWINLPTAMVITGILALAVSIIALRTIEDYFIICTLGIQTIIFSVLNNWSGATNGPLGISGISTISVFKYNLNDRFPFFIFSALLTLAVYFILYNLKSSGFGHTLIAISEDEIFAQSFGKDVYQCKVIAFTISAILTSIPGVLYAHYISYIDPSSFTVNESIFILSIVIIGGLGNLKGSMLAASFLILLPEALRFLGLPNNIASNIRQIVFGLLLILVMTGSMKRLLSWFNEFIRR